MRFASRPLAAVVLAAALGACTASPGGVPIASPTATPPASTPAASPSASAAARASARPVATAAATTKTPWGRIRDAVPSSFPVYPGATAADSPPGGAVSGAWVTSAGVAEVAAWFRTALLAAHWASVDDGGALEDGSHVLDARGSTPGCLAQVTVKPAGGSTMITVLYGAGCAAGAG